VNLGRRYAFPRHLHLFAIGFQGVHLQVDNDRLKEIPMVMAARIQGAPQPVPAATSGSDHDGFTHR
jgi:hypothetical protein